MICRLGLKNLECLQELGLSIFIDFHSTTLIFGVSFPEYNHAKAPDFIMFCNIRLQRVACAE